MHRDGQCSAAAASLDPPALPGFVIQISGMMTIRPARQPFFHALTGAFRHTNQVYAGKSLRAAALLHPGTADD
ncbi:hypothetical protein WT92_31295 [Burkholderia stagnalis]|uniref:hypothetical protein n=1 Tax=Burkholderia stagnalis TaxID=1503054 RepID=UPI0007582BA7|nr:hypothetical protein [Burkholderia stagnalis]KVN18601.1 hypothetical protein WT10_19255 [Burkholderia stagnalis]KVZ10297.1 hypothetical protein WT35_19555 [Burkholderia stagnalis]KWA49556.1 hypothetical protein WT42_20840 [Burkholderia stagnalis]KWA64618.1 hypothetical protein WT43_07555 [Burkholderia stagnalis]KWD07585.1 hypothetical protein WT46_07700 [Burkholderia stagnalis]